MEENTFQVLFDSLFVVVSRWDRGGTFFPAGGDKMSRWNLFLENGMYEKIWHGICFLFQRRHERVEMKEE